MVYEINIIAIKACVLASLFPFVIFFLKRYRLNIIESLALVLFTAIAFYLKSRSAFFCILFVYFFRHKIIYKKISVHVSYTLTFLLVACFVAVNINSSLGRLFIWNNIFKNFDDIGFTGIGFGNFKMYYATWQSAYFQSHTLWGKYHLLADAPSFAFNEWLHFGVELGIIAPLLLSFLLFLNMKWLWKTNSSIIKYCALSNIAIFIFSLISYPLHSIWILLLFALNHLVILVIKQKKLIPICSLFYAVIVIAFLKLYFKENSAKQIWEEAQMIPLTESDDKLKLYELAKPHLLTNQYFLNDYAIFLLNIDLPDSALELSNKNEKWFNQYELYALKGNVYIKKNEFKKAIQYFKKANLIIPNRFIPLANSMQLSIQIGDEVQAKIYAQNILDMPVKIPSSIVENIKEKAKLILLKK